MANAYTATTDVTALIPNYYDKKFLERLLPGPVMMEYGMKKPLPQGNGKVAYFPQFTNSSTMVSAYKAAEGTVISTEKIAASQVSATIEQFANAKAIWDLTELTAISGTVEETVLELADQAKNILDKRILETLYGGPIGIGNVSGYIGKGFSAVAGVTAIVEASAAMAALSAGITADKVRAWAKKLLARNVKPLDDGYFGLICHTDTAVTLQADSAWQAAYQYTDPENIRKGIVGTYAGVKIQTDNNIMTSANGSAGATIYYSVLVGKGAFGVTELDGGVKTYTKRSGDQDTSNPVNQFVTFGWKVNMVPVLLNKQCGLICMSCDA